jgi:hypothetical protein
MSNLNFKDEKECNGENKTFVSLGNYCITSNILKDYNIKIESYPFDWMVSCLDNIIDCIENNFENFLDKNNYLLINSNQTKNLYYFNNTNSLFNNSILSDHQHHDLSNLDDYNYLQRCVNRFNELSKYSRIVFIMIQPLYLTNSNYNIDKINKLYDILFKKFGNKIKLLIFNIIKKNNTEFSEIKINSNLILYELDTKIIIGPYGMEYFDEKGLIKFRDIINNN